MKTRTFLILTMIVALVACGAEDDAPDLPGDPVCISDTGTPAPDFLGLTEEAAADLADERGLDVREVGRDGECFPVTMDLRENRVNLEYIDDVVVGAAIY